MEQILKHLFVFRSDKLSVQFVRYSIVGVLATLSDWSIFFLFNTLFGFHYISALIYSFMTGITVNFMLSKIWVFNKSKYELKKEFIFFIIIGILGLIFSIYLMNFLINHLKFIPIGARILTTIIVLMWNFSARKYFLF